MKKTILVLTGVAILATGAYFGSHLIAQTPGGGTAAQQPSGTRVAIVNIGLVFNKYKRAQDFKNELEETIKPFKAKAKVLTDEMKAWHEASQDPKCDPKLKLQYEGGVRNNQRKLEDMNIEIKTLVGKKQEDNLVTLWREVNMAIEAVSKSQGYQIVLGYGDPMEKDMLNLFPNINRKMQAMDLGSSVPLYVHASVDLSQWIADTLNSWIQPPKGGNIQPTRGGN